MNQPDFRTVNRFRGVILRETIENLFSQLVEELLNLGLVDFEQYFVDGTKMEANANKYSFVWKKSTENYKGKLQEKVKALLDEVDQEQAWEDEVYGDRDLNEVEGGKDITSEDLQRVADKLNEVLRREPGNKKAKQAKKSWKLTSFRGRRSMNTMRQFLKAGTVSRGLIRTPLSCA